MSPGLHHTLFLSFSCIRDLIIAASDVTEGRKKCSLLGRKTNPIQSMTQISQFYYFANKASFQSSPSESVRWVSHGAPWRSWQPPLHPADCWGLCFLTNCCAGLLVSQGLVRTQVKVRSSLGYEIRQLLSSHASWSSSTLNEGLTMCWFRESEILTPLQFGTWSETRRPMHSRFDPRWTRRSPKRRRRGSRCPKQHNAAEPSLEPGSPAAPCLCLASLAEPWGRPGTPSFSGNAKIVSFSALPLLAFTRGRARAKTFQ